MEKFYLLGFNTEACSFAPLFVEVKEFEDKPDALDYLVNQPLNEKINKVEAFTEEEYKARNKRIISTVFDLVKKACNEYEDGETGVHRCLELFLEGTPHEKDVYEINHIFEVETAVSHGIPRSVAEGKKKLSDYFTKEYINEQCGRGNNE